LFYWFIPDGVATTPNQGGAPYLPRPITIVHSKYVVFLVIPTYWDNVPLRRAFPHPNYEPKYNLNIQAKVFKHAI